MRFSERLKQSLKLMLAFALYYTRAIDVYRYFTMKNRGLVLLYHRITENMAEEIDYSPDGMVVTEKEFRDQMRYLSKKFTVTSLDQLITYLQGNEKLPPNLCVITFDDGWTDVRDHAYPVLRKYAIPATIFLVPSYMEGKVWFWEERLKYDMAHLYDLTRESNSAFKEKLQRKLEKFGFQDFLSVKREKLGAYLMKMTNECRRTTPSFRLSLIEELDSIVNSDEETRKGLFLDWKDVQEMVRDGVHFGAHTLTHCNLNFSTQDEASEEIDHSRHILEERLGVPIKTFAYPYGKYTSRIKSIVEEKGFNCACTTEKGFVKKNSDLFALRRINIHHDICFCLPMFACRILNVMKIY